VSVCKGGGMFCLAQVVVNHFLTLLAFPPSLLQQRQQHRSLPDHHAPAAATMTAASPAPPLLQAVPASVVDDAAFEAFALCLFQEAAQLAAEELAQQKEPHQDDSQTTTLKRPTQGVSLPCSQSEGEVEEEGDKTRILIRLQEHCAR